MSDQDPRPSADWRWPDWSCVLGAGLIAAGLLVPFAADRAWGFLLPLGVGLLAVGAGWGAHG